MRAYWWRGEHGVRTKNFGDQINEFILRELGRDYEWAAPKDAELVMAGSILDHADMPSYWTGTICGAGKLFANSRLHLSDARVLALRGKLTLAGATGLGLRKPVLGDPGLLMPMWIRQPPAKYDLGVVPHLTDTELPRRFAYGHVIDPRQDVSKVVEEIASCKRIVSSSLHGLVVADAYGIPRQAERFEQNPSIEGGDFKFRDYQSVYPDADVHWGEMWRAPRDVVREIQEALYAALLIALGIDLSYENRRHPQVSLLVPFRDDGEHRGRVWHWLRRYWRETFPEAEIIQGHYDGTPFSKCAAVNNAARMARGRTFVILDADAYLPAARLKACADDIDAAMHDGRREWYVPYSKLYRLSGDYTEGLLRQPVTLDVPMPPQAADQEPKMSPDAQFYGHRYGALCQVMPREAFKLVNGMDHRLAGWGSDDLSLLTSLDTLWSQHKVIPGDILHLWHAKIGRSDSGMTRQWVGQRWSSPNSHLAERYKDASASPPAMQALVDERPLDW